MASFVVVFFSDGKILYLEPKHTLKELEMVSNKDEEDSTDNFNYRPLKRRAIMTCTQLYRPSGCKKVEILKGLPEYV